MRGVNPGGCKAACVRGGGGSLCLVTAGVMDWGAYGGLIVIDARASGCADGLYTSASG